MQLPLRQACFFLLSLLSSLALPTPEARAQTAPVWNRVITLNDAGAQGYGRVVTDAAGNLYVSGGFSSSITIGGSTFTSRGPRDLLLVKYNPQGQVLWARTAGSVDSENLTDLLLDGNGDVYITGWFSGSVSFGSLSFTRAGSTGTDAYVVKYDEQGNVQWGRQLGSDYSDQGTVLALAPNGDVLAGGWFSTAIRLSTGSALQSRGSADGYVVRLSPATGAVLSGFTVGSPDNDEVRGLAADAAGNIYVNGYFSSVASFGGGLSLTSRGSTDNFVAKFSPQGMALWAWQLGGPGTEEGFDLSLAPGGDVVACGNFIGTVQHGAAGTTLTAVGNRDAYTVRLDAQGQERWVRSVGSVQDDDHVRVLVDAADRAIVSGYHGSSILIGSTAIPGAGYYLLGYDGQGQVQWAKQMPTGGAGGLAPGPATDQLWVSGSYTSNDNFSPVVVPTGGAPGAADAYLALLGGLPTATRPAQDRLLDVYPNPARGSVWVPRPAGGSGPLALQLFTAHGRLLRTFHLTPGPAPAGLSLQGVPPGCYVLRWQGAQGAGAQVLAVE